MEILLKISCPSFKYEYMHVFGLNILNSHEIGRDTNVRHFDPLVLSPGFYLFLISYPDLPRSGCEFDFGACSVAVRPDKRAHSRPQTSSRASRLEGSGKLHIDRSQNLAIETSKRMLD